MTKEEFYKLTDILNSDVLGNFMHGGEASEVIAQFEEAVEKSGILKEEFDVCKFCDEKNTCVDPCCVKLVEKQEPITDIDFEQELYKAFGQVNDFTLGMQIAKRFYNMGRFDAHIQDGDKIVANEEGARVNLSRLKRVARRDQRFCMYSKDNYTDEDRKVLCDGCKEDCKFNKKEEPVSEDLGEYINKLSKQFPEVSFAKLSRIAVMVSRWQRNQDTKNKLPKVINRTDLDEYAYQCAYDMSNDWAIDNPTWHDVEDACKLGANWQLNKIKKI